MAGYALGTKRSVPVRFIDWPAGIHIHQLIAQKNDPQEIEIEHDSDPLNALATAAGYEDGEAFWNSLIERGRLGHDASTVGGEEALQVFAAIESAMTALRAEPSERGEHAALRESQREAWMTVHIRWALKEHDGKIGAVVGAWHTSALRDQASATSDKTLVKDLAREKWGLHGFHWTAHLYIANSASSNQAARTWC